MQNLEFEFDSERELRDTVKKMWDTLGVSGEMAIRPLGTGRWRLELNAERDLKDSTLEKFAAFRKETGD